MVKELKYGRPFLFTNYRSSILTAIVVAIPLNRFVEPNTAKPYPSVTNGACTSHHLFGDADADSEAGSEKWNKVTGDRPTHLPGVSAFAGAYPLWVGDNRVGKTGATRRPSTGTHFLPEFPIGGELQHILRASGDEERSTDAGPAIPRPVTEIWSHGQSSGYSQIKTIQFSPKSSAGQAPRGSIRAPHPLLFGTLPLQRGKLQGRPLQVSKDDNASENGKNRKKKQSTYLNSDFAEPKWVVAGERRICIQSSSPIKSARLEAHLAKLSPTGDPNLRRRANEQESKPQGSERPSIWEARRRKKCGWMNINVDSSRKKRGKTRKTCLDCDWGSEPTRTPVWVQLGPVRSSFGGERIACMNEEREEHRRQLLPGKLGTSANQLVNKNNFERQVPSRSTPESTPTPKTAPAKRNARQIVIQ
ncbi:hypothetical protein C8R45DRAFT_934150 [Mycena sanguinolenta]|nr:hypothetical protein C8R45DRAFT_934150 [Mycena sanguinolenta]